MSSIEAVAISYAFPPMAVAESPLIAKTLGCLPGVSVTMNTLERFPGWVAEDHSLKNYVDDGFKDIRRLDPKIRLSLMKSFRVSGFTPGSDPFSILGRPMARQLASQITSDADVLVSWSQWHSSHLAALGALRSTRKTAVPWVCHFSDPWAGNPFVHSPRWQRHARRVEALVVSLATRITVTTNEQRESLGVRYGAPVMRKTAVIPHCFDTDLFPATKPHFATRDGRLTLRHLGNFYGPRTPGPLLRGLIHAMSIHPGLAHRIRIEFVGEMSSQDRQALSGARALDGVVTARTSVDYLESLSLMTQSDGLLLVEAPMAKSPFLPSKLIDYIGADRPILGLCPPGPAQRLLVEMGFPATSASDTHEIARALIRFAEMAEDFRSTGPEQHSTAARERYTRASIHRQYTSMLEAI